MAVTVATIFLVIYIIIVVLMTGTLILRSSDASLKWEGERYYVNGNRFEVHLACIGNVTTDKNGNRTPTIILEAAEEPSEYDFEHWLYAAYQNGTIDRYCYWDRPGYAWSDNAPSPHSAGDAADELSAIMNERDEEGPYILVSAGYGSIVSRIFSSRHVQQVQGIMMIDPLHEDLLSRVGSPTRGFFLWAWGIISPLGIQRIGGAMFKGRTREDRVYGKEAYQGGKFIKAQLQENLMAQALTAKEIRNARTIQTPDTPLVIVSSGLQVRNDDEWEGKQRDLTNITDNLLSWDVVNKAPHFVWETYDGRRVMEKRLGQLVKKAMKNNEMDNEAETNA
jgi:pimeloyl-ACP methyl ester carboxylesterase